MTNNQLEIIWIGLILLGVLAVIAVLAVGVAFFIRFAKTRKNSFLVAGLIFTFLLPGVLILLAFLIWLPNAVMGYGPPPSNYVP